VIVFIFQKKRGAVALPAILRPTSDERKNEAMNS